MKIFIRAVGSLSAFGAERSEIAAAYQRGRHALVRREFRGESTWVGALSPSAEEVVTRLAEEGVEYAQRDRSALLALAASRRAIKDSAWKISDEIGVLIGSSRGATATLEQAIEGFVRNPGARLPALTSPLTTLGGISTLVAHEIGAHGFCASHSITCSSALHAVLQAVAWMRAEMGKRFLVGGAEAPLTPFGIAQMRALRLYAGPQLVEFPCLPFAPRAENSLVLGEGACILALDCEASNARALGTIEGIGWGIERATTSTGITAHGEAFQCAMRRALDESPGPIDVVVAHAPGTHNGDQSELAAIRSVFAEDVPVVVSNKWLIGHTFGASGAFNVESALWMLNNKEVLSMPHERPRGNMRLARVMVNAAGFGGNAVSVIIGRA